MPLENHEKAGGDREHSTATFEPRGEPFNVVVRRRGTDYLLPIIEFVEIAVPLIAVFQNDAPEEGAGLRFRIRFVSICDRARDTSALLANSQVNSDRGGSSASAVLTINPGPKTSSPCVASVNLSANAVVGGTGLTGTVTLTAAAPDPLPAAHQNRCGICAGSSRRRNAGIRCTRRSCGSCAPYAVCRNPGRFSDQQNGDRKTFTSEILSFLINAEPSGTAMNISPVRVAAAEPHK